MEINLNSDTIIREIMALAAMRARNADARGNRRALVTHDQLPAILPLTRMAFAELCASLGSLVTDTRMDPDDITPGDILAHAADPAASPLPPMLLGLTLDSGDSAGQAPLHIKRSLEHAAALLAASYLLADGDNDTAAEALRSGAAAAAAAVRDNLSAPRADAMPRRVAPHWY